MADETNKPSVSVYFSNRNYRKGELFKEFCFRKPEFYATSSVNPLQTESITSYVSATSGFESMVETPKMVSIEEMYSNKGEQNDMLTSITLNLRFFMMKPEWDKIKMMNDTLKRYKSISSTVILTTIREIISTTFGEAHVQNALQDVSPSPTESAIEIAKVLLEYHKQLSGESVDKSGKHKRNDPSKRQEDGLTDERHRRGKKKTDDPQGKPRKTKRRLKVVPKEEPEPKCSSQFSVQTKSTLLQEKCKRIRNTGRSHSTVADVLRRLVEINKRVSNFRKTRCITSLNESKSERLGLVVVQSTCQNSFVSKTLTPSIKKQEEKATSNMAPIRSILKIERTSESEVLNTSDEFRDVIQSTSEETKLEGLYPMKNFDEPKKAEATVTIPKATVRMFSSPELNSTLISESLGFEEKTTICRSESNSSGEEDSSESLGLSSFTGSTVETLETMDLRCHFSDPFLNPYLSTDYYKPVSFFNYNGTSNNNDDVSKSKSTDPKSGGCSLTTVLLEKRHDSEDHFFVAKECSCNITCHSLEKEKANEVATSDINEVANLTLPPPLPVKKTSQWQNLLITVFISSVSCIFWSTVTQMTCPAVSTPLEQSYLAGLYHLITGSE